VAVGIVEIAAAATVEVVDLAAPIAIEIRIEGDAGALDAGERSVEFLLGDEKGVVLLRNSVASAKSSVTPLLVRTGTKCDHSGPASNPRMSARNLADFHLSLSGMIVWLSSTFISSSLLRWRFLNK
jgi:hypothetical protein